MSIQNIPLNKLRLSSHNVRKTGAEDGLDELVANIEANGVLQNLIGGAARKRGFFDIFAGGGSCGGVEQESVIRSRLARYSDRWSPGER